MTRPEKYHTPASYRIRLKGHLDDTWSEWFGDMDLFTEGEETILSGQVADQAALHGLFIRIRDLNLTLLSVEQFKPDAEDKK
jgi:hypothetical protein